jgi:hypothetical protein
MQNTLEVAQASDGALIETLNLENWEAVDAELNAAAAAHADGKGWIPAHKRGWRAPIGWSSVIVSAGSGPR